MKSARYLYAGAITIALVVGLRLWNPVHVKAEGDPEKMFSLDTSWPHELPAPVNYNYLTWPTPATTPAAGDFAGRWVQGEVAGVCITPDDDVYTTNRAWEVGVTIDGVVQNAESGAIDGEDGTPAMAQPSPPEVLFDKRGDVIKSRSFGNPSVWPVGASSGAYTLAAFPGVGASGRSRYMPHGIHGCFADYQGNLWVAGNGDGIVQKYNPAVAGPQGARATYVWQIGKKDVCDASAATGGVCSESTDRNSSMLYLNEPADVAVDPEVGPVSGKRGDVYIADGYGNHRIVVFNRELASASNPNGYVGQFGTTCGHDETPNGTTTPGTPCAPGTFGQSGGAHPHCVVLGNDGLVYTCDRPNSRIQVFEKSCAKYGLTPASTEGTYNPPPALPAAQPICAPKRVIYIGTNDQHFPASADQAKVSAILYASARAADVDLWPNVDSNYTKERRRPRYIIDADLNSGNGWVLDFSTGDVLSAFGRCGIAPCPGHNPGEFSYAHTIATDSTGVVYIAEVITGRRIQKFVRTFDEDH
jgi:hypothetical protein